MITGSAPDASGMECSKVPPPHHGRCGGRKTLIAVLDVTETSDTLTLTSPRNAVHLPSGTRCRRWRGET